MKKTTPRIGDHAKKSAKKVSSKKKAIKKPVKKTTKKPVRKKVKKAASNTSPIQHVVIIFKENHGFDNYFGSFL